jgi:hypothetical protein
MESSGVSISDTLESEVEKLKSLWREVTQVVTRTFRANMSGNTFHCTSRILRRKLTLEEFEYICKVAPHFIVVPARAQFGFNFGVTLYIEPSASFPGVQQEFEDVFFISGEFLPDECGRRFDNAWKVLSPLSHNETNRQKLARNGLEPPQEKSHYMY